MSEYVDDDFDVMPPTAASPSAGRRGHTVQDTLGLKERTGPKKLSPNALKMTQIDRDVYHDCVDRYDAMSDNLESGSKHYSPFENLSEDIFNSLYKYNVNMNDADDVQAKSQLNHQLMEGLLESDEYQNLRSATKFDMMNSAIGTEVLQDKAMEKVLQYKEAYEEQKRTGQATPGADAGELIETLNNMSSAKQQIDYLQGLKSSGQKLTAKQASELAALKQDYKDYVRDFEQNKSGQKQMQQGVQQATKAASKAATIQIQEVQDIVEAWGLGSGDHSRKISLDERRQAIERIRGSERLKKLTDLVGRFRALATKKRKKPDPVGHNIKSIKTGNDISRLIPSELANLAHPTMKKDFMRRYTENGLLIYDKDDRKSVGQGPIILLQDKSGSTQGTIDDWSTALALATIEVAQREKRDFAYVPFDDEVLETKDIKHGELDPQDILDIAEMDANGGTNFMKPLERALKVLEDSRYKKADVIFITDGQSGVSDEFLSRFKKVKEEKNFFVNTVLINLYGGGGGVSRATVDLFSDQVTTISSIADLDEASAEKMFNLIDDADKFAQGGGTVDPNATPDPAAQTPSKKQGMPSAQQLNTMLNADLDDEDEEIELDEFGT